MFVPLFASLLGLPTDERCLVPALTPAQALTAILLSAIRSARFWVSERPDKVIVGTSEIPVALWRPLVPLIRSDGRSGGTSFHRWWLSRIRPYNGHCFLLATPSLPSGTRKSGGK